MKQTVPIALASLPNQEVVLTCLTVKETEEILAYQDSYFQYIFEILDKVSNLARKDIEKLYLGEAFALLIYYRMYFWDDIPIASVDGENGEVDLLPSDFIGGEEGIDAGTEYKIGEYKFTPFITLNKAITAERMALRNPQTASKHLKTYVLASGCTKSLQHGIKAIEEAHVTPDTLGALKSLSDDVGRLSSCTIDLLSSDGKINVVANKGGELYALGFRGSQFFSFWL